MSEVSTIKAAIKTRVAAVLGGGYSELPHVIDIEKNSFKSNTKGYGVLSGSVTQDETFGVLKSYSVAQTFTIKLVDTFSTKPTDDSARQTLIDDLMDNGLDIFKDLVNTRAGAPSLVIHVIDLEMDEVELVDGTNAAHLTMNFTIKYRKAL